MRLENTHQTAGARLTCLLGPLPRLLFVLLAAAISVTTPTAVLAQQPARAGAQAFGAAGARAGAGETIRPFRVRVPEEALVDLRRRLAATRWPDQETVADRSQGVRLATMKELIRYWQTDYDWRKAEAKLNALPQFVTTIDGVDIHFVHVRSRHQNALPLIMTHGWPGSVFEMLKTVGPLTDPTRYGSPKSSGPRSDRCANWHVARDLLRSLPRRVTDGGWVARAI